MHHYKFLLYHCCLWLGEHVGKSPQSNTEIRQKSRLANFTPSIANARRLFDKLANALLILYHITLTVMHTKRYNVANTVRNEKRNNLLATGLTSEKYHKVLQIK